MRTLRRILRLVAFLVITAALFSVRLAGRLFSFGHLGRDRANRLWVLRTWSRTSLKLLGFSMTCKGTPPAEPGLIVSNHLSYMDILAFSSVLDVVYVTKQDVRSWPVIGLIVSCFAPIFVDRESVRDVVRVSSRINESVTRGESVVLFAEGTSSRGDDVLEMKASLLQGAAADQQPVHYASISYRTPPDEPHPRNAVCWWRDMELLPHLLELLEIRSTVVLLTFGEKPIVADDRKVLATQLHAAVRSIFTPVDQEND